MLGFSTPRAGACFRAESGPPTAQLRARRKRTFSAEERRAARPSAVVRAWPRRLTAPRAVTPEPRARRQSAHVPAAAGHPHPSALPIRPCRACLCFGGAGAGSATDLSSLLDECAPRGPPRPPGDEAARRSCPPPDATSGATDPRTAGPDFLGGGRALPLGPSHARRRSEKKNRREDPRQRPGPLPANAMERDGLPKGREPRSMVAATSCRPGGRIHKSRTRRAPPPRRFLSMRPQR